MGEFVDVHFDDTIATLTIDRSSRHNSLIPPLLDEVQSGLTSVREAPDVACLVIETAGSSFSTGGDVKAFYDHRDEIEAYANRTVGGLHDVIRAMLDLRQPIITAVDGRVNGGAIGFLAASDLVYLTEDVTITPYYPMVGFTPDGGWTAIVPRLIGRRRTSELLLTNRTISATEAVDWGLATGMVTDTSLRDHVRSIAEEISGHKQGSITAAKRLLQADRDEIDAGLINERTRFIEQIQTPEAIDGMATFLDGT